MKTPDPKHGDMFRQADGSPTIFGAHFDRSGTWREGQFVKRWNASAANGGAWELVPAADIPASDMQAIKARAQSSGADSWDEIFRNAYSGRKRM